MHHWGWIFYLFWYDNWHPIGPLIDHLGSNFAAASGIPLSAKVSAIIFNDNWTWTFLCDGQPPFQPRPHLCDSVIWAISPCSKYHVSSTWNALRTHYPHVAWHKLIWFPKFIPRHSFIFWLAIKSKLRTKDKLKEWGVIDDAKCFLCNQVDETLDISFLIAVSLELFGQQLLSFALFLPPHLSWGHQISWLIGKFTGKTFSNGLRKIAWAAMVYFLWQERNSSVD